MNRRTLLRLPLVLPLLAGRAGAQGATTSGPLTVFAAASLTDALRALDSAWQAHGGTTRNPALRMSFAASSTLARQIEQGAPADLFASADEQWADYLQQRDLLAPGTRTSPLGNTLVLVAGPSHPEPVTLTRGMDFVRLLGPNGRLATGDPAHVPVGIYAQAALTWLGVWDAVNPRLARAESVRAALLLVERGEAPFGIVYATDAAIAPSLKVVATFPSESHPPVTYPFALTRRAADNPAAKALLAFLTGPEAAPTWRRFGFRLNE